MSKVKYEKGLNKRKKLNRFYFNSPDNYRRVQNSFLYNFPQKKVKIYFSFSLANFYLKTNEENHLNQLAAIKYLRVCFGNRTKKKGRIEINCHS